MLCGARGLSGSVLNSRSSGCGFEPHRRHLDVSISTCSILEESKHRSWNVSM